MIEHKVIFKFEIGDLVSLKGMKTVEETFTRIYPQKGIVVSQLAEFCSGGVQNHYGIRWISIGSGIMGSVNNIFKHQEIELVKWSSEL